MAKKDDIQKQPQGVVQEDISTEMRKAYLDYAMSVITTRALPDIRDGLKPVNRRILYAMHGMGLRSTVKTRKSAAVTGEVLGKFHPHGDSAVYEAMVKLVQPFTTRYPLVIGQGNFGSIDGDNAAAARYTEVKLSKIAEEMVVAIDKETVPFRPNYENTLKEPVVLPAIPPLLLLNGTLGIAVGMATNIPPHNLREICEATLYLIEHPQATTEDIMQFVQGPDFPLGAVAYDTNAMKQVYATGRGGIIVRGESEIVETPKGTAIIITSIPYRVNKSELIGKIGTLVRDRKIEGAKDLRDESTEDIRIVLELKGSAQPYRIQNILYKHTQLEDVFHYNMVALIDGVPQTVNLQTLLQSYIGHRRIVVERRFTFELNRAKEQEHIFSGLKKALDHIDAIISLIRGSKDVATARKALMKKFSFSEKQTQAILEMKLQKLAGLERKKVEDELKQLQKTIATIEAILKSSKKIDAEVSKEIVHLRDTYGDDRRTKIVQQAPGTIAHDDLIPETLCMLMITEGGYIKKTAYDAYKKQKRGGIGTKGAELKAEDFTTISLSAHSHDTLFFFTDRGKVYKLKTYDIPEGKRTSKGRALVNFIGIDTDERVTSIVPVSKSIEKKGYLLFVTKKGVVKKVAVKQFDNIRKTGIIAISLESKDQLVSVNLLSSEDDVFLATGKGKSIRFKGSDVRATGRGAKGVRGIMLQKDDTIIGGLILPKEVKENVKILIVSAKGYGKQTKNNAFKVQKRGGSGIKVADITEKTGRLISAHMVDDAGADMVAMSRKGQIVRFSTNEVPTQGRQTQGVRIMRLRGDDTVTSSNKLQ